MRAFDAPHDAHDTGTDRDPPPVAVDWGRFDRPGPAGDGTGDGTDRDGLDDLDVVEEPGDGVASSDVGSDAALVRADDIAGDRWAVMEPELVRVPVHELYPSRFVDATAEEHAAVERARRLFDDPHEWVPLINPEHIDDAMAERPEHTENCAACSRAVQDTLDGVPQAAAGLAEGGLDLADGRHEHGEHPVYTERWAGRPAESTTYDDIDQRLRAGDRSAIVFGSGGSGGHAFNAVRRGDDVLYVDGQTGEVSRWVPDYIRQTFPEVRAIFFDDNPSSSSPNTPGGRR